MTPSRFPGIGAINGRSRLATMLPVSLVLIAVYSTAATAQMGKRDNICGAWNNYCRGGAPASPGGGRGNSDNYAPPPVNALSRADQTFNYGNQMLRQERLSEAQFFYEEALRIDPSHDGAMNNLGITLERLGRYENALAYYARSMNLGNADGRNNYTRVSKWLNERAAWEQAARERAAREKAAADARRRAEDEQRLAQARARTEAIRQIGDFARGRLEAGQIDVAIERLQYVLRLDPQNAGARALLEYAQARARADRVAAANTTVEPMPPPLNPPAVVDRVHAIRLEIETRLNSTSNGGAWAQAILTRRSSLEASGKEEEEESSGLAGDPFIRNPGERPSSPNTDSDSLRTVPDVGPGVVVGATEKPVPPAEKPALPPTVESRPEPPAVVFTRRYEETRKQEGVLLSQIKAIEIKPANTPPAEKRQDEDKKQKLVVQVNEVRAEEIKAVVRTVNEAFYPEPPPPTKLPAPEDK